MVLFNYATKEITAKIVYYGPGLCGKTTNLQFIYDSLPSGNKSKMLSLATKSDRTLFFDFLPLDLGKIRGMRTKLQLYTVPGQVFYNSTRQLVLKGADGVVFVADSQDSMLDANVESLLNLDDNLRKQGVRITDIPVVIQYNKRDLPSALPIAQLQTAVNKLNVPAYESVATTGMGVEQTLRGITHLVLSQLVQKYGLEGSEPLDRELAAINPIGMSASPLPADSVWADDMMATVANPSATLADPFVLEEAAAGSENLPLVTTELLAPENPFENVVERFDTPSVRRAATTDEIPPVSVEIPLPQGIRDSLPMLETPRPGEARTALVREISIPVTLSAEELRNHRKLQLKITLDVNLI
jgi:signal recognition particle receptor subunit beta